MKSVVGKTILLLALVGAAAAHAQDIPRPARPPRPPVPMEPARVVRPVPSGSLMIGVGNVEGILRDKEELKLTDQQVAQLETIRKEEVARRQAESRDQIDLESRFQAGLVDHDAWRDEMEKRSIAARSVRDRIEKILTVEQRDQLDERRFRRAPLMSRDIIERLQRDGATPFSRLQVVPRVRIPRFEEHFEPQFEERFRQEFGERFRQPFEERFRDLWELPRIQRFRWERNGIL
jgi:Spy/CpxP family protein refolding chaperone